MVIVPVVHVDFEVVEDFTASARGERRLRQLRTPLARTECQGGIAGRCAINLPARPRNGASASWLAAPCSDPMAIRDWPRDERPREKLLEKGAAALSDAELLAILLRTGIAGHSALDLARDVLKEFHSLRKLIAADRARFCAEPGLGPGPLRRTAGRGRNLPAAAVGVAARRPFAREPAGNLRFS